MEVATFPICWPLSASAQPRTCVTETMWLHSLVRLHVQYCMMGISRPYLLPWTINHRKLWQWVGRDWVPQVLTTCRLAHASPLHPISHSHWSGYRSSVYCCCAVDGLKYFIFPKERWVVGKKHNGNVRYKLKDWQDEIGKGRRWKGEVHVITV